MREGLQPCTLISSFCFIFLMTRVTRECDVLGEATVVLRCLDFFMFLTFGYCWGHLSPIATLYLIGKSHDFFPHPNYLFDFCRCFSSIQGWHILLYMARWDFPHLCLKQTSKAMGLLKSSRINILINNIWNLNGLKCKVKVFFAQNTVAINK